MSSPRAEPATEPERVKDSEEMDPKLLTGLRRNWKWAAVCDFLWTFNTAMRLDYLDYHDLEKDIINGTTITMATVIIKMLFTLTAIRGLGPETWQIYLRRHLAKRDEKQPLLGTDEEPLEIKDLTMDQRLGLMHNLCEWQFQDPTRLRQNMGHNDDTASWRTIPIGRDAKRNTYWQYGRDRLWIQRPTTKAPPPAPQKRKKGARAKNPPKSKKEGPPRTTLNSQNGQAGRAARARARAMGTRLSSRLRQGEGDPEWQEPPEEWLKGASDKEEKPKREGKPNDSDAASGSIFGADSDLTDISDSEQVNQENQPSAKAKDLQKEGTPFGSESLTDIDTEKEREEAKAEEAAQEEVLEERETTPDAKDPNFVELETICITLEDWKKFSTKFEKSAHKDEKRLHRHIIKWIIPDLERRQEELDEIERKRQEDFRRREEAAAKAAAALLEKEDPKFKRQTRRAVRAGEIGSDVQALRRQRDVTELEERRRRGEVDARLDDDPRTKRASARNARRLMIEDRADGDLSEALQGTEGDDGVSQQLSDRGRDEDEYRDEDEIKRVTQSANGRPRRAAAIAADAMAQPKSGRRRRRQDSDIEMDDDDPWFLNCEICHKTGWNENDGQKLLACSSCDIWQHVACHDLADQRDGRPKRDWKIDKFTCKACQEKAANKRTRKRRKKEVPEGEGHVNEAPTEPSAITLQPAPMPISTLSMQAPFPAVKQFIPQPNGQALPPVPQQYELSQFNFQMPIPSSNVPLGEPPSHQLPWPGYSQAPFVNGHSFPSTQYNPVMSQAAYAHPIPSPMSMYPGPPILQQQQVAGPAPQWAQPSAFPNGTGPMEGIPIMNGTGTIPSQQSPAVPYFLGNPGP